MTARGATGRSVAATGLRGPMCRSSGLDSSRVVMFQRACPVDVFTVTVPAEATATSFDLDLDAPLAVRREAIVCICILWSARARAKMARYATHRSPHE